MSRQMTKVKNVSGTELVNAYFTMVRSDIAKSVAALRAKEDEVFYQACDNLISSAFLAVASMRAYKQGSDITDPEVKDAELTKTKALFINRMNHDISDIRDIIDSKKK